MQWKVFLWNRRQLSSDELIKVNEFMVEEVLLAYLLHIHVPFKSGHLFSRKGIRTL